MICMHVCSAAMKLSHQTSESGERQEKKSVDLHEVSLCVFYFPVKCVGVVFMDFGFRKIV